MQKAKTKVYFPGLNGLRFFAALAVIITHVELLKGQCGVVNFWSNTLIFNLGGLGVYFFFVLSGFLITYLLMEEKRSTGKISIRDFYIRRILRIWPLYYLLILLGFFVFPQIPMLKLDWLSAHTAGHLTQSFLLNLFMFPNLALALFGPVAHIGQAWSIGVEEQFYLLWPVLVRYSKNVLRTVFIVGLLIVLFKICVLLVWYKHPGNSLLLHLKAFVAMSKIECMAIGASGAYFIFYDYQKILRLVYHPLTQIMAYASIPLLIYFTPDRIQDGIHLVYSVSFLLIIMNVSTNKLSFLKLENKVFDFLGRISYGLYMYHMVLVVLIVRSYTWFSKGDSDSFIANCYYYAGTLLMTIGVAWISNAYFEKWFLKQKARYSNVLSSAEKNEIPC